LKSILRKPKHFIRDPKKWNVVMGTTSISVERTDTRAGRIAYRRIGNGPYAVFWHSLFVDGHSWDRTIAALSQDRTLIVVDGPGYGESDALLHRSSMGEAVGAADDLIEAITDEPVDFVGNAWGGHIGANLAVTNPSKVKSLVTICTPTQPISAETRRQVSSLLPVLLLFGPIAPIRNPILKGLLTERNRARPEVADNVTDALRRTRNRSLANTLRSFMLDRTDGAHLLPGVQCPTLLIAGDDWLECTPEAMSAAAASMSDARSAVIPGARALAPLEQPDAVIDAIRAFWAR
jgi:pimeloyl-ACP methyl ester carboxylesterase